MMQQNATICTSIVKSRGGRLRRRLNFVIERVGANSGKRPPSRKSVHIAIEQMGGAGLKAPVTHTHVASER